MLPVKKNSQYFIGGRLFQIFTTRSLKSSPSLYTTQFYHILWFYGASLRWYGIRPGVYRKTRRNRYSYRQRGPLHEACPFEFEPARIVRPNFSQYTTDRHRPRGRLKLTANPPCHQNGCRCNRCSTVALKTLKQKPDVTKKTKRRPIASR